MRTHRLWLKLTTTMGLLLMPWVSMSANAGLFGLGGDSWKEEVLLHDGSMIIVERTVERGGRHEIGQIPPIKEQRLSFTMPGTNQDITWEDRYSEDIGTASFLPMLVDVLKGTAYLVATPMGCMSYGKWGRPNPPYVIFRYEGEIWKRIALQELPAEIKSPNLVISSPDDVAKTAEYGVLTAERVKKANEGFSQAEYRSILREAMQPSWDGLTSCPIPTGPDGKPIVTGADGRPLSLLLIIRKVSGA